jgi:hypothetical protein
MFAENFAAYADGVSDSVRAAGPKTNDVARARASSTPRPEPSTD